MSIDRVMYLSTALCLRMGARKSTRKLTLSFVANRDRRFLSNTAAARLPAQQPKTQSAYAAHGCYAVLGLIYYGKSMQS